MDNFRGESAVFPETDEPVRQVIYSASVSAAASTAGPMGNNMGSPENQLITRLIIINRSFLESVDRATVLDAQGLQGQELIKTVFESFSPWERLAIEKFDQTIKQVCGGKTFDLDLALNAREKHRQVFSLAKAEGLSTLQATRQATMALRPAEVVSKDALAQIIACLGGILEGPSAPRIPVALESKPVPKTHLAARGDALILTQMQIDKILNKLEKAHQQGELSGVAAQTPIQVLEAQLLHHAANWTPSAIKPTLITSSN